MDFEFTSVDRFIIGTIGMPGEREFFLQVTSLGRTYSFAMEKGQAAALSERMRELLREVRRRKGGSLARSATSPIDDAPLQLPVESEFRLGEMSLMWVDEGERVLFQADSADDAKEEDLPKLSISLRFEQASEFIRRTDRVVGSGRAPCPFCGLPLNLEGHLCPRANGYRR